MTKSLIYFNVYGRAEPMRMLLAHANVEFNEERLVADDWPAIKASGRFVSGTLPAWQQDGQMYFESKAILRFIGAQHGYYPSDPVQAWKADSIVDFLHAFFPDLNNKLFASDFGEETQKMYLENLEKVIKNFGKVMV